MRPYLLSSYRSLPRIPRVPFSRLMSTHTYQEAVEKLNTLQSNAAALDAVRASGGRISQFAIPEMLEYLGRIGYTVRQRIIVCNRGAELLGSQSG